MGARAGQLSSSTNPHHATLAIHPFRGFRPQVSNERIGHLLCPPYDVIDEPLRNRLLAIDPDNAVGVVLPEPTEAGYASAAKRFKALEDRGVYALDAGPGLYIYEMRTADGAATRGLLGAVELRDPADGVILPHENTMAGPVADRLEVMTATGADLEPIYLVYDGGGAASAAVRAVDGDAPLSTARTPDGVTHRLWTVRDDATQRSIADDLADRHALIADGHHRYATYRERQRLQHTAHGPGPWDRGLALLVDSTDYGPQVHAIHRVIPGLSMADAISALHPSAEVSLTTVSVGLDRALAEPGFAVIVTNGDVAYLVTDPDGALTRAAFRAGDLPALADLDVTVVHRGLVESVWRRRDDEATVEYAHSVDEAIDGARRTGGTAVLLRPTPVTAVAAVAAAGARMPRKSTLFTPKPASGFVMRRLADET